MADYATVGAAEALLSASSGGAWTLADALVKDTKHLQTDTEVAATLEAIAETLGELGIVTPNGDAYLVPALTTLRRNGLAWPPADRHPVAAYRTHFEVINSPAGRAALAALARVAAGEDVERPAGVDAEAWLSAKARVERRREVGRRQYLVAANDIRIVMQRTPNVPRTRDPEMKAGVVHLLDEVRIASSALRGFARRFVDSDPSSEERELIGSSLERLIARAQETLAVVAAGSEVSDEALAALLVEEESK